MKTELQRFYEIIDDSKLAMMTTRRPDGHLRSRPMANQKASDGADLWFVTMDGTAKISDLRHDPHVHLSYFQNGYDWVSASGIAEVSLNREKIHELYATDWKAWFPKSGDPRDGTPDDPRIVLIGVTIHAAEFFERTASRPVVLYEVVKGWLTGETPEIGSTLSLDDPHRPLQER